MDLSINSERHPPLTTIRQEDLEQELSVSYVPRQVESGGAFSLQVLEFKTCLLEAIEELQIRRDAEIRFGQQISKLVLEKQELEWQTEQKLALQSRSKDSHLNQLREVEKRIGVLSRLCATVKQAHGKLEHNVDEAIRINRKLTSTNEKQESTIISLTQELEEMNSKLIKVKVRSVVHPESSGVSAREQHVERLRQRLLMELMRSLQVAQQLLLSQTPTLHRLEMELHQHTEEYQTLKRDHEATLAESAAAERRVASLTEEQVTIKTIWEKEVASTTDKKAQVTIRHRNALNPESLSVVLPPEWPPEVLLASTSITGQQTA
ncbi:unnamed protein product [Merluccius merluccius]